MRWKRSPAARRSASSSAFASASCTRFSPKSRRPAAKASRTAEAGCVLLTPMRRTPAGSRETRSQAVAIRSRTACSRPAIKMRSYFLGLQAASSCVAVAAFGPVGAWARYFSSRVAHSATLFWPMAIEPR